MTKTGLRNVNISSHEYGLPYSKGLMASRIMATGLAPARAFHVAQVVEDRLHALGDPGIAGTALTDLVLEVLHSEVGERYAEDLHRSHFLIRAHEIRNRPSERYLDYFENIRKQQKYVKSLALEHGVPIVPSNNLDVTLTRVIDLVFNQAIEAVPQHAVPATAVGKRGAQ